MRISNKTAKNILDFLARKLKFDNVIIKNFKGIDICNDAFYLFLQRNNTEYFSIFYKTENSRQNFFKATYSNAYSKMLLDIFAISQNHDVICIHNKDGSCKTFLNAGTTLEHVLLEMDLESCVR